MIVNQIMHAGDNSVLFQAGGHITVVLSSVEELAGKILNSVFGELTESAKNQILKNQNSYLQLLLENLKNICDNAKKVEEIVNSPDFQYISKHTIILASRSSSEELHARLSSLLVRRMEEDQIDLGRIIYNDAIFTVSKLTTVQINFLSLLFLINTYKNYDISTPEELILHFKKFCLPLVSSVLEEDCFYNHIESTGCGIIRTFIVTESFSYKILNQYPGLFCAGFKKEELFLIVQNSKLFESLIPCHHNKDLFQIDAIDDKELYELCNKSGVYGIDAEKVKHLQNSKILKSDNVDTWLKTLHPELIPLMDFCSKPKYGFSISSTGLAIVLNNIYYYTGKRINIFDWLKSQ